MNGYISTHYNGSTILEFTIQNAEVSRSRLVKLINLTKLSTFGTTKILIEKSLVYELNTGVASVSGGRKPIYLSSNNEYVLVIVIEIGGDHIHSSLSYINGESVNKLSYHSLLVTKDTLVMLLAKIISNLTSKISQTPYDILEIGMAIHGTVKGDTVLFTPYLDADSTPLKDLLAKEIPYPVVLINKANAGALGECTFKTPSENLVNINTRDGIGAGVVENDKLPIGTNSTTGEVGHATFYPDSILCLCGNHGCSEHCVSTRILLERLFDSDHKPHPDISVVVKKRHQGDVHTQKILKHNAKLPSTGINDTVLTYDPGAVIINSKIYQGIPELIDEIKKHLTGKNTKSLTIKNTSLEGSSTLYGCISIVAQSFLKINNLKFTV